MVTRRGLLVSGVAVAVGSAGCVSASVPDVTVVNATASPLAVTVRVETLTARERTVTVPPDDPATFPTLLPDNRAVTLGISAENGVSEEYTTSGIGSSYGIHVTVRADGVEFDVAVV